jgi:thioredoxin-related protein
MNKIFLLLLSTIFSLPGFAQVKFIEVENINDYQAVINTVQQREKMMFVVLHDNGGDFRKMFFDQVFSDPSLVQSTKNYTCIAVDLNEEMGARYAGIFEIEKVPAFFLMNHEELVINRLDGYLSAKELTKTLNETFLNRNEYDSLLLKYNRFSLSDEEWVRLLEIYSLNFDYTKTSQLALEFINSKKGNELFKQPVVKVLASYGVDFETSYPMLVVQNQSRIKSSYAEFDFKDFFQSCYSYNLDLAIANKDSILLKKVIDEFVVLDPEGKQSAMELSMGSYNLYGTETEHYSTLKEGMLKFGKLIEPADSASEYLFDAAYQLVENQNNDKAIEAAQEIAKLSDQRKASFKSRMLVAYTAYLLKDFELAEGYVSNAAKMAKSSEQLRNATKLQGLIKEELASKN